MANPYIRDELQPAPGPGPEPAPVKQSPSLAAIAMLVACAGLFMPADGCSFDSLPIPVPPFNEPHVDPAESEGAWVIVVEETGDRPPEVATILADLPYWDSVGARGLRWRPYDVDADEAAPYRKIASEVGLPAVLILSVKSDPPGKVLGKFPLPVGENATSILDAKIKEATGR